MVIKAFHRTTGQFAAIKVNISAEGDDATGDDLLTEAMHLKRFSHPKGVQCENLGVMGGLRTLWW
jgi:hypothetical protein